MGALPIFPFVKNPEKKLFLVGGAAPECGINTKGVDAKKTACRPSCRNEIHAIRPLPVNNLHEIIIIYNTQCSTPNYMDQTQAAYIPLLEPGKEEEIINKRKRKTSSLAHKRRARLFQRRGGCEGGAREKSYVIIFGSCEGTDLEPRRWWASPQK